MRIIGGTLRGKKLFTPQNERIRPTSDKARGALFNILHSRLHKDIRECLFLDVFAGTGAIGLEALSRGAKEVVFVDIDITLAKKNALLCGFKGLKLINKDARKLPPTLVAYDIIFMDAPYNLGLSEPTLINLKNQGYITNDTFIVIETARDESFFCPQEFILEDERIYGAAKFYFLRSK